MSKRSLYLSLLQNLLPPGQAWTREHLSALTTLLNVVASELALIDERSAALTVEADPRTTLELLPDWENVAGLPDLCTGVADTLQERRQALHHKVTNIGGQSIAYYEALAQSLGYEIEIEEFSPFVCGIGQCGYPLGGGHNVRYYWRVSVPDPRTTYFRTGLSRCSELLLNIDRAEDLECLLSRLAPAHTNLLFNYEGV